MVPSRRRFIQSPTGPSVGDDHEARPLECAQDMEDGRPRDAGPARAEGCDEFIGGSVAAEVVKEPEELEAGPGDPQARPVQSRGGVDHARWARTIWSART